MSKIIFKNKPPRVVIAMSGGVDSSVAAYLLKKQGYDVIGIFLKLWEPGDYKKQFDGTVGGPPCGLPKKGGGTPPLRKQNLCCDNKAMAIAGQIANKLKIPFYVLRVDKLFKKEIVDNFISEYEKGRTPNPCVRCNRYIKFGYLWEKARQLKVDYLATGHYVGKIFNFQFSIFNDGVASRQSKLPITNCRLHRSKDLIKDQTYFLSQINPKIIPHLLFPLGDMTKKEVRLVAKKAKLTAYNKKDSMGVCFIPDGDTDSFLKHFSGKFKKRGEIVDKYENVVGKHEGLLGYTVGQRMGGEIFNFQFSIFNDGMSSAHIKNSGQLGKNKVDIPRLYVIGINVRKNQLIVGKNEDCFSTEMVVEALNILDERFWDYVFRGKALYTQIRGGHRAEKATVESYKVRKVIKLRVRFAKPVRAITPGQTAAFYDEKGALLGGGIIS